MKEQIRVISEYYTTTELSQLEYAQLEWMSIKCKEMAELTQEASKLAFEFGDIKNAVIHATELMYLNKNLDTIKTVMKQKHNSICTEGSVKTIFWN